jgi:hypothetical protein
MNLWHEPLRQVCNRLRRNDARLTSLDFAIDRQIPTKSGPSFVEGYCAKLFHALETNTVVSTIYVCVTSFACILDFSVNDNTCGRAYNQFLQFIATHSSLRNVELGKKTFHRPSEQSIDQFCSDFLSALALNPNVVDLRCWSQLSAFQPTDLATFLLTTRTLTLLRIAVPESEVDVQIIASGIEGNESLKRLELTGLGRIAHAVDIFRQLPKCTNLRKLSVSA